MSLSFSHENKEVCSSCGILLDSEGESLFALVKCPQCGSEVRIRRQVGRYELLGVLGQGGSGRVFRARFQDEPEKAEIALKILEKSHPDYEEHLGLMKNEAKFAQLLDHARVVKVLGFEEEESGATLLLELMEGGSLHDLIVSEERLSEVKLLRTGLEISKALSAAYAKGIIHCDLKPANILFTSLRGAKLGDFGLARNITEESGVAAHLMATPDYVAPEVLCGKKENFRSDLYSLGATLYHGLTGQPLYRTEGLTLEQLRLLKKRPMRLFCTQWKLFPDTATLINRMIDPDPAQRFASYGELDIALQATLARLDHSEKDDVPSHSPLKKFFSLFRG